MLTRSMAQRTVVKSTAAVTCLAEVLVEVSVTLMLYDRTLVVNGALLVMPVSKLVTSVGTVACGFRLPQNFQNGRGGVYVTVTFVVKNLLISPPWYLCSVLISTKRIFSRDTCWTASRKVPQKKRFVA